MKKTLLALGLAVVVTGCASLPHEEKPLKILIITGSGWHDYPAQRGILEQGLKARLKADITHVYYDNSPNDKNGDPKLPIFGNPHYADGYDVVIHDECAPVQSDPKVVEAVLTPHRKGIPAVNLHCAMHSYRTVDVSKPLAVGAAGTEWFEFVGIQSIQHGPQAPIVVTRADNNDEKTARYQGWVTGNEELYNNLTLWPITPILYGQQPDVSDTSLQDKVFVVAWTHTYGPNKTRVFSTTLGHNNATVADNRYLDMVADGVLWATGRDKLT